MLLVILVIIIIISICIFAGFSFYMIKNRKNIGFIITPESAEMDIEEGKYISKFTPWLSNVDENFRY